jgi:hypothetical protein
LKEAHVVGDPGVLAAVAVGGEAERDDGEVAVVAALAAEREVDVGGSWRQRPRRRDGGGGRGIPTNRWWVRTDWGRCTVGELEHEREG